VIEAGVIVEDDVEIFPGAFIGKEPKGVGATNRTPQFERRVRIGRGSSIGPHAVIFYDVEIGEQTLIGDGASIREQCRIGSQCIISRYVTLNYNCIVGNRVKIMDLTHITGNSVIEEDCFISIHVSTVNDNQMGVSDYSEEMRGPYIRRGAHIGANAVLLPNIEIGEGATVAAGSVVTKDVAAHALVMGTPARQR
jgi:acetyltransferase-like isoleucine patch superfamily enzyme